MGASVDVEVSKLHEELLSCFYRNNKRYLFYTIVSRMFTSCIGLWYAYIFMEIINAASSRNASMLWFEAMQVSGLVVVTIIFQLCDRYTIPRFMRSATYEYRKRAFDVLLNKGIQSVPQEKASQCVSAFTNDLTSIETSYLEKIFDLVTYVLLFGGALAMLVVQDVRLAVVAVLLSIAPVCVSLLTGDRLASRQVMVSNESDSFVASTKDLVAGFSFIKSFMAEPAARRIFDESNRRLEDAKCAQRSTRESIAILSQLAYFVTQLGTALFAAWLCVEDGSVTPGTVLLVGQLMNYFSNPILQIPQVIGARKSAHQLVGKLCELLATQDASDGTRELPTPLTKGISLSGVSFSYDCNRNMLDDISFDFHTGGCYAIVGGTGSGKSTLLSLLMGEHAGYTGEISYDRICVGDIRRTSLYRRVSIVRQENYLFNASLRDNITMFKEADEASLDRAVAGAGLVDFVRDHGMEWACGERGSNLSGGERQRVCIARSLLNGAEVLLLDEITSALDRDTATQVMRSVFALDGTTRIVVTHSLEKSQLKLFDAIIVLRWGSICECGRFDELMQKNGYFKALYTVG